MVEKSLTHVVLEAPFAIFGFLQLGFHNISLNTHNRPPFASVLSLPFCFETKLRLVVDEDLTALLKLAFV